MLDIKFIRENKDLVREGIKNKNKEVDLDLLLRLDEERRSVITELEELRAEQNKASEKISRNKDKIIVEMKKIKEKIKKLEEQKNKLEDDFQNIMLEVPNIPDEDVPVGPNESCNKVIKTKGEPTKFNFDPQNHMELGEALNLIDTERAAKVSGARFCYLKNEAALLQLALIRYTWDILTKKGFTPVIPPVLSKIETVIKAGHPEALSDDAYRTAKDDLALVGSSEQSLVPMHMDEILDEEILPLRYTGYSTCFRREAGSYGKDTKGIIRQHQFDKIEMVSFTKPEESDKEFEFLLAVSEELISGLDLPYRIVSICSGDMVFTAAKQVDIEIWMPGESKYRETHSVSNCRDFQTRRLNTKYKNKDGKKELTHALNATAFAMGRTLIAILENYQQKDGSVKVPKALQKYCGFKVIKAK